MVRTKEKGLKELLNHDPVKEAEDLYSRNTKVSQTHGLASMMKNSEIKNKMLDELGDSKFSNVTEDYIKIINEIGFNLIYKEKIIKEDTIETLYVYWFDELGILLNFDTYNGNINGSTFHYNWMIPFNYKKRHSFTSSGSFVNIKPMVLAHFDNEHNLLIKKEIYKCYPDKLTEEEEKYNKELFDTTNGVWIGNHDGREAIKHKISGLKNNGNLLTQWKEPETCLLITTSEDFDKSEKYLEKSIERIKQFPEHVKIKICFDKILKNHKR